MKNRNACNGNRGDSGGTIRLMRTLIYALVEPDTGETRYIGKTMAKANRRINQHIYEARVQKLRNRKSAWIRSLLKRGLRPALVPLETCEGDGCAEECRHIAAAKAAGTRLTNLTTGGEGAPGDVKSAETREKIRARVKGCKRTDEFKANVSQTQKALWQDPEYRAMMLAKRAKQWKKPENAHSLKVALGALARWNKTPEGHRNRVESTKRLWADPAYRAKVMKDRKRRCDSRPTSHPLLPFPA
jgi:hypothetical protein